MSPIACQLIEASARSDDHRLYCPYTKRRHVYYTIDVPRPLGIGMQTTFAVLCVLSFSENFQTKALNELFRFRL
jgi:hypothetical protein